MKLAILSDIHYASAAECARPDYCQNAICNPLRRVAVNCYRRYYWLRDPFAHNHLLDTFIERNNDAELVVANGDFSCDTGFIGISDRAAFQSAQECLEKLRGAFPDRLHATIGDHELGKKPLAADTGGVRIDSYYRATEELKIPAFWRLPIGNHLLVGITSTLVAWPVYMHEALPQELAAWQKLRAIHMEQIRDVFSGLAPNQRVLLFCHDPTALAYLWEEAIVQEKIGQLERTIIGHLHSPFVLFKSRLLAGMPKIGCFGHTVKRLSSALRQARCWKHFKILLCPSLAGMELLKDGGYYRAEISDAGSMFTLHRLPRS